MNEQKWAIITGTDGGIGTEITRAVATAGYRIVMACHHPEKAEVERHCLHPYYYHEQMVRPADQYLLSSFHPYSLERRRNRHPSAAR